MLSEHDRRELALIEERLRSDDQPFADTFQAGRLRPRRDHRWMRRALVGFGAFILMVGLAAGDAGLFLQGLLVFGAGIGWTLVHRWTAAGKGRSAGSGRPGDSSRGDASPPEWHRPI